MSTAGEVEQIDDDVTGPVSATWPKRAMAAIDERLGLSALQYPVPAHANTLGRSLGGLTAAFGILLVTGLILAQFYDPAPAAVNQSVRTLVTDTWGGELFRGIHFWAAQAMYVLAALHLLRVFVTASYKRPREGNRLIGIGMFALVIGAIFTGSVLKWDQEGFEALAHNLEIAKLLGGLGFWFTAELSPNVPLLTRLYVAHIAIIPALITALLLTHGALIKRHGIAPLPVTADASTIGSENSGSSIITNASDETTSWVFETRVAVDRLRLGTPGSQVDPARGGVAVRSLYVVDGDDRCVDDARLRDAGDLMKVLDRSRLAEAVHAECRLADTQGRPKPGQAVAGAVVNADDGTVTLKRGNEPLEEARGSGDGPRLDRVDIPPAPVSPVGTGKVEHCRLYALFVELGRRRDCFRSCRASRDNGYTRAAVV